MHGTCNTTKKALASDIPPHITRSSSYYALATNDTSHPDTSPPPSNQPTLPHLAPSCHHHCRHHIRHALHLLSQQDNAFLQQAISRAENECTQAAKLDATNPFRCTIDKAHTLPNRRTSLIQTCHNARPTLSSSLWHALQRFVCFQQQACLLCSNTLCSTYPCMLPTYSMAYI